MRATKSFFGPALALLALAASSLSPISSSVAENAPTVVQRSFSAGFDSTCALRAENKIYCVGGNAFSQLGNGFTFDVTDPRPISRFDSALSVSVGKTFACAISVDEHGSCWGTNSTGQLALGDIGLYSGGPYAGQIATNKKLIDIQAGDEFGCALSQDYRILCWGGIQAITGLDVATSYPTDLNVNGATAIAVGPKSLCYIAGSVFCVGVAPFTSTIQVIPGTEGATDLSVGRDFACAIVSAAVKCWGSNTKGQLGQGNTTESSETLMLNGLSDVKSISAGDQFACALSNSGNSFCWGDNSKRQISASGEIQTSRVPTSLSNVVSIDAGSNFLCAMLADGSIKCIGDNSKGQSGIVTSSAVPFGPWDKSVFMKVAAGTNTTCVINESAFPQNIMAGNLSCWGDLIPSGTDSTLFVDVAVGNVSACAVTVAGAVWCWGANGSGQLGDGTNKSTTTPTVVTGLGTYKAEHVAAGFRSFCTNTKDGLLFCWGDNSHQQLGYVGLDSKTAVVVPGIGNATNVSSGLYHSCVLVSDGTAYCWGDNSKKQILNNSTTRLGVTQVPQAAVVTKVASGGYENCFLMNDSKLNCIGDNSDSQSPGLLTGPFLDVSVGLSSVCVVQTDYKQAACFGSNSNTKLGRTGLKSSVPSVIPNMDPVMTYPGFRSIAVGDEHACAIKDNAYLFCWGANNAGQLGSSFGFPKAFAKVTVAVSGLSNVGETLLVAISSNEPQATVSYSWNKANDSKVPGLSVNGAISSSYVPVSADEKKYLNAVAVFSKWGISSEGFRSNNYGPVGPAVRILVTAVPTVLGKTKVGQQLLAKPGAWESGVRFSYQWYRGTSKISNATSTTYKLVSADVGKQIYVAVTGTKIGLPKVVNKSLKTAKITR